MRGYWEAVKASQEEQKMFLAKMQEHLDEIERLVAKLDALKS
jgi:hypothetical protein